MISIKSKRKETTISYEETKPQLPTETREQIINGGIDLVNIIYDYVEHDCVGLSHLTSSIDCCLTQQDINDNIHSLLGNLSEASASLSEMIEFLKTVVLQKADTIQNIHITLNGISKLSDVLRENCNEFKSSHLATLDSIYKLKGQIKQCKEFVTADNLPMQALLTQMEEELKHLESTFSSGYVKNDLTLSKLPEVKQNSIMYYNESISLKEKLNISINRIHEMIEQLNNINIKLAKTAEITPYLDQSIKLTSNLQERLTKRKQDNSILLSDLISFLVQLKSILNFLKEES
ncbi:MAG: hypothetical protein Q4F05_10685 [bacterium]|nr:hypothetical protein [bacterium]